MKKKVSKALRKRSKRNQRQQKMVVKRLNKHGKVQVSIPYLK